MLAHVHNLYIPPVMLDHSTYVALKSPALQTVQGTTSTVWSGVTGDMCTPHKCYVGSYYAQLITAHRKMQCNTGQMAWHVRPVTLQLTVASGHTGERIRPTVIEVQEWIGDSSENQSAETPDGRMCQSVGQASVALRHSMQSA